MTKATEDQIAAWKKEHRDVFEIKVNQDYIYLKKPSRQIIALAATKGKKDPLAVPEVIIFNCQIGGATLNLEDPGILIGLAEPINDLIEEAVVEVKKL